MTTFQSVFQSLAAIDAKIEEKRSELEELSKKRKDLEIMLLRTINDRDLTSNEFKIGESKYSVSNKNVYSSITFTYLNSKIKEILGDNTKSDELLNRIKSDREIKVVQELKKKHPKIIKTE